MVNRGLWGQRGWLHGSLLKKFGAKLNRGAYNSILRFDTLGIHHPFFRKGAYNITVSLSGKSKEIGKKRPSADLDAR
jgi:hypothetical protein